MSNRYLDLEKVISIEIKSKSLLNTVFVHRSYLNEHKQFSLPSNEKMEFLGDSVLSLITSVYLFKNYPALQEGDYTEIKSAIVKTESLAIAAATLNLGKYLYLSKGEELGGGRTNKNILADCFEALIACIFIDRSFEKAYTFICRHLFQDKLDVIVKDKTYQSSKSRLQEIIQAKYKTTPSYQIIEEKGPEHKRIFTVAVYFADKKLGAGTAGSKKEAEEKAARAAFENIKSL